MFIHSIQNTLSTALATEKVRLLRVRWLALMLVLPSLVTFVLAFCAASYASSSPSFSGLPCIILDTVGVVAPGLLPLASPAVEDNAATAMLLPAEPLEPPAATQAPP